MNALGDHLAALIAREGPISVATYMATALLHPQHGYYATRDPFGAAGDFITAPEISQMFGECIGAWIIATWRGQGAPAPAALVELGPGRGTLMADVLRTARQVAPDFAAAVQIHMIEASPVLRAVQRQRIGESARWHASLDSVPDVPLFLLANEFFDALPIRQFVRTERGWCERCVGLDDSSDAPRFVFRVAPEPSPESLLSPDVRHAGSGAVAEICPAGEALCDGIAQRLNARGGAALIVDYGPERPGIGDTFQAVKAHRSHDPLTEPGSADLTAHVDFTALARAAERAGARAYGPVAQGAFLRRLGLFERAEMLMRTAERPADIASALRRLTAADAMGTLFKALALTSADASPPPAFDPS